MQHIQAPVPLWMLKLQTSRAAQFSSWRSEIGSRPGYGNWATSGHRESHLSHMLIVHPSPSADFTAMIRNAMECHGMARPYCRNANLSKRFIELPCFRRFYILCFIAWFCLIGSNGVELGSKLLAMNRTQRAPYWEPGRAHLMRFTSCMCRQNLRMQALNRFENLDAL